MKSSDTPLDSPPLNQRTLAIVEVLFILMIFFLLAGSAVPDVNEAHYLTKAKHYWNPDWCSGDHFLESRDAHLVFTWLFGWLTLFMPLTVVAWAGRILTWLLLAWSWRQLSFSLIPRPLFSILSAAMFLLLLERCHLAGEWVVGGVEAKGFAFVCVFFALESFTKDHWARAWLLLGAATFFHVLVGGWSLVAACVVWVASGRWRPTFVGTSFCAACAVVIALPNLIAALSLNWDVDAATIRNANGIYVYQRLAHHLSPHTFAPSVLNIPEFLAGGPGYVTVLPSVAIFRHVGLLIVWSVLWFFVRNEPRQERVQAFVVGAVVIALVGAIVDAVTISFPETGAALLRYYWFRLSDVMLPLGVVFGGLVLMLKLESKWPVAVAWSHISVVLVTVIGLGAIINQRIQDPLSKADRQAISSVTFEEQQIRQLAEHWRRACQWVEENTDTDERFLTPHAQQTFKWYAGRSEVVTWKDVPQDARAVVEWWSRYRDVYPPSVQRFGLAAHSDELLRQLATRYGAKYIIVDRTRYHRVLGFPRLYPNQIEENSSYEVYRLPPADSMPRNLNTE